jgi:hypothetical protein
MNMRAAAGADRIITGSLYHLRSEETVSMYLELLRAVDEGDGEEQD